MPNKATKNMMDFFKNPFQKPTPQQQIQEERNQVSACRARERELSALLDKIQSRLEDSNPNANNLSPAKIEELDLGNVIAYIKKELSYPLIVEQDLGKLDNYIKNYINALDCSVREGLEETARWSCTALITAIKSLRIPIDGIDEEFSDELFERRLQYAANLDNLVKTCIDYDKDSSELNKERKRREEKRSELNEKKAEYIQLRNSGAIDAQLAELKQKANDPAALSDEARDVQTKLNDMHYLKSGIATIDIEILNYETAIRKHKAEIGNIRNQLASAPRVSDPNRQAKINKANELYLERLRSELNKTEEGLRAYEAHLVQLAELAKSGAVIKQITSAIEEDNKIRLEELEKIVMETEAAGIKIRDIETQNLVKNTIQAQQIVEDPIQVVQETAVKNEVPKNTNLHTINIM